MNDTTDQTKSAGAASRAEGANLTAGLAAGKQKQFFIAAKKAKNSRELLLAMLPMLSDVIAGRMSEADLEKINATARKRWSRIKSANVKYTP